MPLKKNPPWNVLVFPAASEVGLEIHRALRDSKEVILHGANLPGASLAAFHFRRLHELPSIHDPACLPHLRQLVAAQNIDAIFPAYDDALVWLAEKAGETGAAILAPDAATCRICRSKSLTYETLAADVPVPRVWQPKDADIEFPVFVKPDRGQGSQRARRIDDAAGLAAALAAEPDLLIMEYLPGREYTVDCFSASGGGVLFARARERLQTKTGIATLTRPETVPEAMEWAKKISRRLNMRGAWFFQMKEDAKGQLRLLEVAPRIAGSMAQHRVMGPNFPLLSLYDAAGHEVLIDAIEADIPMGRSLDARFVYDRPIDALYVDLDDTLLLRGEVNARLVALIYQCRNRGVPVHALTRHKGDLPVTLEKFRLTHVFDRIVHITDDTVPKSSFIREKNAVLIDDSFAERSEVARTIGIRCFDAAGAACLFDERA